MKTLTEQIAEAQADLVAKKDALVAATKALEETPDDATQGAVVEATTALEKATDRLAVLKRAETALASQAAPAASAPGVIKRMNSKDTDYLFGKLALVEFEARCKGIPAEAVIKNRFGESEALETMIKAVQNPAMSNVAGYAQELTQVGYGQFMDLLREQSILARSVPLMQQHQFAGFASINVPFRAGGPTDVSAAWRAEGAPIPVKGMTFSSKSLTPKNLGVIVSATEEMLSRSAIDLSAYFQSAIVADTAEYLDATFVDATAGSTTRPAGIRNGLAGDDTRAASGTGTIPDIIVDVKDMVGELTQNRMGSANTRWLMSPANYLTLQMAISATGALQFPSVSANGTLAGYGIISSSIMPDDIVLLVDFAQLSDAIGAPAFLASQVATIHEETVPSALSTVGTPNVVAAPIRSLFQTNSWALRMLLDADWAVMRAHSVQELTAVAWQG